MPLRLLGRHLGGLTESLHSCWPSQVPMFSVPINIVLGTQQRFSEEYEDPTVFSFRNILTEALIESEILEKEKTVDGIIKRAL